MSKFFEKVIASRLSNYLKCKTMYDYVLLSDSQYGFRKYRSTQYALLKFVTNVSTELDKKKSYVASTFLDISKAFDLLDHNFSFYKLYNIGMKGQAHKLLKSFLTNRKQCFLQRYLL